VIGSAGRGDIAWSPGQLTAGTPPLKAALQSGVTPSVKVGGVTEPRFPEASLVAGQSKRPPPPVGSSAQYDDWWRKLVSRARADNSHRAAVVAIQRRRHLTPLLGGVRRPSTPPSCRSGRNI
jgi:hypothetical protein